MHLNIIREDFIVGYTDDDYNKYKKKVEELLNEGYHLKETEWRPSGDKIEYYVKDDKVLSINHLAI